MVKATLYKAEWCEPCHKVRAHLDSRGVAIHEIDISENPEASRGIVDIPVTVFSGTNEIVKGYNRTALDNAIRHAGGSVLSTATIIGIVLALVGVAAGIYIMSKP